MIPSLSLDLHHLMPTGLEQKGPRTGPRTPLPQPEQQAIFHRASFSPGGFAVILLNASALNLASFVSRWGACALRAQTRVTICQVKRELITGLFFFLPIECQKISLSDLRMFDV